MNKLICLCLISLQLVGGIPDSVIFTQPGNVISEILNVLASNFTQLIQNVEETVDVPDRRNDQLCMEQVSAIVSGLNNSELWAMKMIDSWGKIPSGILYGNVYELGQFDECLSVKKLIDNQNTNVLKGQHCVTQISLERDASTTNFFDELGAKRQLKKDPKLKGTEARLMPTQKQDTFGLNIGICVPDSCLPSTLTEILNYALNATNVSGIGLVSKDLCHTRTKADFDTLDIITISFFGIIALLMTASTIYDVLMTRNKKKKQLGLTAFSIYSNAQKIFHCKKSTSNEVMDCLNGIRVLSIVWVVFGHAHMIFMLGPLINPVYMIEWISHVYSMLLVAATVSVDSFFLLSGLLVAWSSLKHLEKSNGKLNIFLFYFHRYIRLTPSLAVLILLSSSLIRHFGSGPLWDVFLNTADKPCHQYWWSTLLYVQNYVNPSQMCLGHSWYLSVDMQLFILSPILIYPLWRWRHKFVWIVPILIAGSMSCVFTIYMTKKYSSQMVAHMMGGDSMITTYYPTHTRMGAWLVGVLLGYILHNLKGKSIKIPKTFIAIGWCIAIGTMLSIIFGIYFLQQPDYKATVLESAFYESFSRVCWAISLSWIIFACIHGYGGPVNWFLSLPQWQPLARLSYSIYLVHLPIQLVIAASTRTQNNFSDFLAIHKFWGDFGVTLTVALFWTLAFESPVLMLEKIMFSKSVANITVSREDLIRNNFSSTEAIESSNAVKPSSSNV